MKAFKPVKDENKPKRPMTSFLFFLEEFREAKKSEGLTGPGVSKQAGEEWRCMSDSKKEKYCEMSRKAKAKYDQELKEYTEKVRITSKHIHEEATPRNDKADHFLVHRVWTLFYLY